MSNVKEILVVGKYAYKIQEIRNDFTVKCEELLRKIPIRSIAEENCFKLLNFTHPNVQRVYSYKNDSSHHYFAAEHGINLKDYTKREEKISLDEIIDIMQQSTQGLQYLHSKDIFHGNICASNIIKAGNKWKLANFEVMQFQTLSVGPFHDISRTKKMDILSLGKTFTNAPGIVVDYEQKYRKIFFRKLLTQMISFHFINLPTCEAILNDIVFWDSYKLFNFLKSLGPLWFDLRENLLFMDLIKEKMKIIERNLYDDVDSLYQKIKYYEDHLFECFKDEHLLYYLNKLPVTIHQIYQTTIDILSNQDLRESFVEWELKQIEKFIPREVFFEKRHSIDIITPEEKELQESMAQISAEYLIKSSEISCSTKLIGKGQFKVYEGVLSRHNEETNVAIKKVDRAKFEEMKREVYNLCTSHCNTENIIKFFGYYHDNDYYPLVLELAIADLNKFMENKDGVFNDHWNKITKKEILSGAANGVLYLHQNQPSIIHLDLKPENILIVDRQGDGNLRACIADFGKSRQAVKAHCVATCSGVVGTKDWYSPEMRELSEVPPTQKAKITIKSDIYQLGLIFGFILIHPEFHTRRAKFGDGYKVKQNMLMKHRKRKYYKEGLSEFAAEFLILNMIKSDPDKRFDAENVVKNPFFWDENKIEKFLCQIVKDHKGHSSNVQNTEKLNNKARKKVFYEFTWIDIIDSMEIESERKNSPKTKNLDTTSFLDLIDFIIQVKKDEKCRYFSKTRAITNATDPPKFWEYWFRKFEFLLVYAYYDVKVINYDRINYYSNLCSVFGTPKRKLISLIKKRNELRKAHSRMLTSACLSDERKISYMFDLSLIKNFVGFSVKNRLNGIELVNNEMKSSQENQAISQRTFNPELESATNLKLLTEKLYDDFLKYNEGNQKFEIVVPRKKKRRRYVRVNINRKSESLTLEFQKEESITM